MENDIKLNTKFITHGLYISSCGNISDCSANNRRTIYDTNGTCGTSNELLYEKNNTTNESRENEYDLSFNKDKLNLDVNIFRYKFSDDFIEELFTFSRVHQFEERKHFKESWNKWLEENNEIVTKEMERLTNLGYEGDIIDKMYKSARYYFRKKGTEKKAPKIRREYIGSSKRLRDAMDTHILKNINNIHYKPSDGFDDFCKINLNLLTEEVKELCKLGIDDPVEIKNKFKKTYKNRYFIIIK